ncbi:MAG: hypothetical protein ABRQ37_00465 [Candidatus Eremiobacterota bacterium]
MGNKAASITKLVLGTGKLGADYEAFQALKAGVPKSYLWLGSNLATKLGMLGGAYKVFTGVKGLYDACLDKQSGGITDALMSKETKIVNAGLNIAEGAALTAVNTAFMTESEFYLLCFFASITSLTFCASSYTENGF